MSFFSPGASRSLFKRQSSSLNSSGVSGGLKGAIEEEALGRLADTAGFILTGDSPAGDGGDAGRRHVVVGMSVACAGKPRTSWSTLNDVRLRRGEIEAACARARNCSIFRASFDCPKGEV